MIEGFLRALRKEKQYLTPIQRAVFITVGLCLIAVQVPVVLGAIHAHRYRLLWFALPMQILAGYGAAMIRAAALSSPDYRQ